MDKNTRRLVDQLCTQAGIMMEDASVLALTSRSVTQDDLVDLVQTMLATASRTAAILNAARAICE